MCWRALSIGHKVTGNQEPAICHYFRTGFTELFRMSPTPRLSPGTSGGVSMSISKLVIFYFSRAEGYHRLWSKSYKMSLKVMLHSITVVKSGVSSINGCREHIVLDLYCFPNKMPNQWTPGKELCAILLEVQWMSTDSSRSHLWPSLDYPTHDY